MKINYLSEVDAIHFINFFKEEEYNKMWVELAYLCDDNFLLPPDNAGGTIERTSRGLPIESLMESSDIISFMDKLYEQNTIDFICKKYPSYDKIRYLKNKTHLINHYMEGQSYGYHKDNCEFTAISIFHKMPKLYEGGLLTFRNNDSIIHVPLMPRDLVLFHSNTDHAVSPVKFKDDSNKSNLNGRISVSQFIK